MTDSLASESKIDVDQTSYHDPEKGRDIPILGPGSGIPDAVPAYRIPDAVPGGSIRNLEPTT